MYRCGSILLAAVIVISAFSGRECCAQDLYGSPPPSLYCDKRAFQVGDIVTILIVEQTAGINESSTNSNFEDQFEGTAAGTGSLDFISGLGFQSGFSGDQEARGKTARTGSLQGKMSARVIEVLANGMMYLEGQRTVAVNGEEQVTILNGLVRPNDITANNTIYSYLIADAKITYRGKGTVNQASKPGIFSRFLSWLF